MKPPRLPDDVAILNLRPELEVVLSYMNSRAYLQSLPANNRLVMEGLAPEREMINPIADRFLYNATEYDRAKHKTVVKEGAEYALGATDASIALAGAQWLLSRKNPVTRIKNKLNGRADAAVGIIDYLVKVGVQPWQGME